VDRLLIVRVQTVLSVVTGLLDGAGVVVVRTALVVGAFVALIVLVVKVIFVNWSSRLSTTDWFGAFSLWTRRARFVPP